MIKPCWLITISAEQGVLFFCCGHRIIIRCPCCDHAKASNTQQKALLRANGTAKINNLAAHGEAARLFLG
ncbi:MAG: hypothetical protein GY914_11015 [Prochlorococcus sp.]|nr:hypothetical protein [Prochlorococcus sp.]